MRLRCCCCIVIQRVAGFGWIGLDWVGLGYAGGNKTLHNFSLSLSSFIFCLTIFLNTFSEFHTFQSIFEVVTSI